MQCRRRLSLLSVDLFVLKSVLLNECQMKRRGKHFEFEKEIEIHKQFSLEVTHINRKLTSSHDAYAFDEETFKTDIKAVS